MKKFLQSVLCISAVAVLQFSAQAEIPQGYYSSLEGKCGVELKKAVKALAADHVQIPYGDPNPNNPVNPVETATWSVFPLSDTRTIDGRLCWWDMYSANNMWVSSGHIGLNIEHSVPQSWWKTNNATYTPAYYDLHHLNPSEADANGRKGNNPLGIISGEPTWTNGVTSIGKPQPSYGISSASVFEPYPSYRGDFARAYFYIFTIYDDIEWQEQYNFMYDTSSDLLLRPWAYNMLLEWNSTDPVSMKEVNRNDAVYGFQKNRNPFIDCPTLADHIWGDKKDVPFTYVPFTPATDDPESYPGWDEIFPELNLGYWAPVASNDDINEDEEYFIVSPSKMAAMTYSLISTNKAIDKCVLSPEFDDSFTPALITSVPLDIATVKLEQGEDGWYLAVYDPDYNFVGYISVSGTGNGVFSQTKTDNCLASIDVDGANNKTVITYTNSGCTLQFNSGNPRFAGYTSNQTPIQLYRATDEVDNAVDAVGADAAAALLGIFDINGRKVNAASADQLQKGIYIIVTEKGARKVIK